MKTQEDILKRVKNPSADDFGGFEAEALAQFLDYDHAKPILRDNVTREIWDKDGQELTRENVVEEMRGYMEFAWGKVRDHRGISANRSVIKLRAWLWLLDEQDTLNTLDGTPYPQYGAPQLEVICRRMGFPIPEGGDIANMIAGRPCTPTCDNGCG